MSYINSLNLLGTDHPNDISEETLTEELSLWANAQFTFDTEPGSALLDDLNKETKSTATHKNDPNDLFATLTGFGKYSNIPFYFSLSLFLYIFIVDFGYKKKRKLIATMLYNVTGSFPNILLLLLWFI